MLKKEKVFPTDIKASIIKQTYVQLVAQNLSRFLFEVGTFYNVEIKENFPVAQMDMRRYFNIKKPNFRKAEELRLIEYFQTYVQGFDTEFIPSFFFIYADFVKETMLADSYVNLLKMIPYKNGSWKLAGGMFISLSDIFFEVNKSNLRTLDFNIRAHSGKEYLFFSQNDPVRLTLKFQKV
jgi:hypothetical protein